MRPEVIAAILSMGVVAYGCRVGGFFLMRYVPLTPAVPLPQVTAPRLPFQLGLRIT